MSPLGGEVSPSGDIFGELNLPRTSQPEMDPDLKGEITAEALAGADPEELFERFGEDAVNLAALNNLPLLEILDRGDHAA